MKKNILILSGSPRQNGNSETLCAQFAKGAQAGGHAVETIFLRTSKIAYCTGCGACMNTNRCVIQDDMAGILEKMVSADVLVFATPVYFYTMDAQMKTLIDRTVARYQEMTGKEIYYIITAADTSREAMQKTLDGFRGFADDCLEGAIEKGIVYGLGAWHIGDIQGNPAMQEAYDMGRGA